MTRAKKQHYHHGDLRRALLQAARQALREQSLEKLSLRGLAKTLGVSPTAVYGHFADKTELLVELKTQGFHQLTQDMRERLERLKAPADAEQRLRALGLSYLDFAREHPHLFDVLFGWTPELERLTPECIEAGNGCEALLRATVIELITRDETTPDDYLSALASFSAWSLVHGIATLLRTGCVEGAVYCDNWPRAFSEQEPDSQRRAIEQLLSIQIAGLRAACAGRHNANAL